MNEQRPNLSESARAALAEAEASRHAMSSEPVLGSQRAVPAPELKPATRLAPSTPPRPQLRLVRTESDSGRMGPGKRVPVKDVGREQVRAENRRAAALSASDARRIMAEQVAHQLDGGRAAVLSPERRRNLVATAAKMGLRPFDTNLIIAVVQDSVRRGVFGRSAARDERLLLIPHPALLARREERFWSVVRLLLAALAIAGILAVWAVNWLTGRMP